MPLLNLDEQTGFELLHNAVGHVLERVFNQGGLAGESSAVALDVETRTVNNSWCPTRTERIFMSQDASTSGYNLRLLPS